MFVMMVMKKERWLEWWEEGCYIDNYFALEPGFLLVRSHVRAMFTWKEG
jgi:hypothetical protein